MTKQKILEEASSCIQSRNLEYGLPSSDFSRAAEMLTALFSDRPSRKFNPWDIAVIQILVKLSRIQASPEKQDHWIDIAGYAACGYEAFSESAND